MHALGFRLTDDERKLRYMDWDLDELDESAEHIAEYAEPDDLAEHIANQLAIPLHGRRPGARHASVKRATRWRPPRRRHSPRPL